MFELTESEFLLHDNACEGFCTSCGDVRSGVESDAERYFCESCRSYTVFGMSILLLSGKIDIIGDTSY